MLNRAFLLLFEKGREGMVCPAFFKKQVHISL